jgi:hypothetical protein
MNGKQPLVLLTDSRIVLRGWWRSEDVGIVKSFGAKPAFTYPSVFLSEIVRLTPLLKGVFAIQTREGAIFGFKKLQFRVGGERVARGIYSALSNALPGVTVGSIDLPSDIWRTG